LPFFEQQFGLVANRAGIGAVNFDMCHIFTSGINYSGLQGRGPVLCVK